MDIHGPEFSEGVDPDKIQAELSTDQVVWLEKQSKLIDKAELLKYAVMEWVVRHPVDWRRGIRVGDAVQLTLDEFVDRHKDEFLSVD
jgi:hypothetical protein